MNNVCGPAPAPSEQRSRDDQQVEEEEEEFVHEQPTQSSQQRLKRWLYGPSWADEEYDLRMEEGDDTNDDENDDDQDDEDDEDGEDGPDMNSEDRSLDDDGSSVGAAAARVAFVTSSLIYGGPVSTIASHPKTCTVTDVASSTFPASGATKTESDYQRQLKRMRENWANGDSVNVEDMLDRKFFRYDYMLGRKMWKALAGLSNRTHGDPGRAVKLLEGAMKPGRSNRHDCPLDKWVLSRAHRTLDREEEAEKGRQEQEAAKKRKRALQIEGEAANKAKGRETRRPQKKRS